jgi:putative ABC transport system permease protein
MISTFITDLRYAIRALVARPGFALVAVASLALGIGVNTAIYSLFHQAVMKPLAVAAPEPLVNFSAPGDRYPNNSSSNPAGGREEIFSYPMYLDLQQQRPPQLAGIAAHRSISVTIGFDGQIRNASGMLVSGNYFALLGLLPAHGRLLGSDDAAVAGSGEVAVLEYSYWQNMLGGDPDVVGRSLRVNGESLTIVGVAPPGFSGTTFGTRAEVFVPITLTERLQPQQAFRLDARRSHWVYLFGRLAPGATLDAAASAINLRYAALLREIERPLMDELTDAQVEEALAGRLMLAPGARGQSGTARNVAQPLRLLLAVAGLVLLIACMNIAGLLLARGASRAGEFAVRVSLGAGRGRLIRQLLVEALLVAVVATLVAIPLAMSVARVVAEWMPQASGAFAATLEPSALRFAVAAAFASVLLFGLFPAWQLARTAPVAVLRGESGQAVSRNGNRFRSALATGQVALAMASLALAGLLAQSLANLAAEDLGMQVESLAVFSVAPERAGYDAERRAVLYDRIEQELAAGPGVLSVASSMVPLLARGHWDGSVVVEGYEGEGATSAFNRIGTGFFDTFSIPLLAGRDFSLTDNHGAPRVAVINRRFAEHFGLLPDPVGKRLAFGRGPELDIEIVGVVADSKYSNVKDATQPVLYLPRRQIAAPPGAMNFYVRSAVPPETLLTQLPTVIARLDPELPVSELRTVNQQIQMTLGMERFVGLLSGGFALLATLLAALGLYGVLSYTLSQRTREIGLRLALGAAPRRVSAMLMSQVGRMLLVGGVLGLIGALLAGRAAQSLLFGLQSHDPLVLGGAALLLGLVALGAGMLPARRAARVDPMVALRHN